MKPQPMLESDFQARVIAYAELNGWRVFHPRPARIGKKTATWQQGHKGYPDLTLARDGVVILAELKRDGEYPSPDQRSWRDAIGPQWRLWRPSDWPAVKAELDRPRRRPASPVQPQKQTGVSSSRSVADSRPTGKRQSDEPAENVQSYQEATK